MLCRLCDNRLSLGRSQVLTSVAEDAHLKFGAYKLDTASTRAIARHHRCGNDSLGFIHVRELVRSL